MKYPKYTREQNISCKLTDEDIKEVRRLHRFGKTKTYIASLFGVGRTTIIYWLKTEEEMREHKRKQAEREKMNPRPKEKKRENRNRGSRRKREVMPEVGGYFAGWRAKNREHCRDWKRKYVRKHPGFYARVAKVKKERMGRDNYNAYQRALYHYNKNPSGQKPRMGEFRK